MKWRPEVYVDAELVANENVIYDITITHGRTDITSQPMPGTATVTFFADAVDPDAFGLSRQLVVYAITDDPDYGGTPFIGRITDCRLDKTFLSVVATSEALGALARITTKPSTAAGTIVEVLSEAFDDAMADRSGLVYAFLYGSAPWPMVAVDWPRQSAITTLQQIAANDPAGVFAELARSNIAAFITGQGRREQIGQPRTVEAAAVIDTWTATKSIGTKVNKCRVTYGTDGLEAVSAKDQDDIDAWAGAYDLDLDTRLAEEADARFLARWNVARGVNPTWALPTVTVDFDVWTDADWWWFNGRISRCLEFETPLSPIMPTKVFVEGWTYRVTPGRWLCDFYVSDPALTIVPQRWQDVTYDLAWEDVDADLTWDDLLLAPDNL